MTPARPLPPMRLLHLHDREEEPVDPAHFTGAGTLVRLAGLSDDPKVNAYRVRLEAGGRMAWHSHTGVQLLLVTEGTCRLQVAGEPVQEIAVGGIASIAPGERHWHGASTDGPMTHVAVNIDAATTWYDAVTDEEYAGRP